MGSEQWRALPVPALGAWLSLSPLVIAHPHAGAVLSVQLSGVALFLFGMLQVLQFRAWETWSFFVVGVWLVSAPMALDYAQIPAAAWNSVLVGAAVVGCALSAITRTAPAPPRASSLAASRLNKSKR